jgi:hypothetical protein
MKYMLQPICEVNMNWIVFSYSLPGKSGSGPRVSLWRRLRRLGAISPAGGAQVLPARDECLEAFQWLAREIRQAKGEAVVMRVEQFEGLTDQQLIDQFHAAREEDYAEIERSVTELDKTLGKRTKPEDRSIAREALEKLRRRYLEIRRVDYFNSPAGDHLANHLSQVEQALSAAAPAPMADIEKRAIGDYCHKQWVTRPRPHVDRLACSWLIRRFIDAGASIRYAEDAKSGEIAFDMDEGEFGHRGNLCTFEVLRLAFALDDPALPTMAEIVHEIDLHDGRYVRSEIAGIDAILNGWQQTNWTDAEREAHGIAFFEGLYQTLASNVAAAARRKRR